MKLHIHHDHYHHDPGTEVLLRAVEHKLDLIIRNQESIMATMAELQAAVTRNENAENSVVTLLQGISQQLKDAKASSDPAAIDAVVAQLDASTDKLSAAVVANTPSA